jgi:hypothetical protein
LNKSFGDKIPVAAITAASKYYGKGRPLPSRVIFEKKMK